jgi:voltage-gated potassium channel
MKAVLNLLLIFTGVVIIGTVAIYAVESQTESEINTILDAVWWTVATITTVGYGDIVPLSELGRIIGIFYMFFGVTFIALSISIVGTRLYKKKFEKEEEMAFDQKKILGIIKKLEDNQNEMSQSLKEIRDGLKQNKEEFKKEI